MFKKKFCKQILHVKKSPYFYHKIIYLHDLIIVFICQPPPQKPSPPVTTVSPKESKSKTSAKKKPDPPKIDDNVLETGKFLLYKLK